MGTIRITPEELRNGSSFLRQKIEAINSEVMALKSKVNDVASAWEGAAQSSFVDSFNQMCPMLEKDFPNVIEGIAAQLEGAANTIEEADAQIAQAFRG